ncbi:MAG: VCBS repeat-containing protein [Chryseolinea sp.]
MTSCLVGCGDDLRMELIPSSHSGVTFRNEITESDSLNVLTYEYIYNGGGVGVADFNNDGMSDLFFTGNMVSSRLYLNRGDFHFDDITDQSKVLTSRWCTGVSIVDIDQDGWMDIYVSTASPDIGKSTPNLLFRNKGLDVKGIPVFEEIAAKVGLDDLSYSTQAAFLDYDRDGDLDMYLLTNALENYTRNSPIGQHTNGTGKSVDKLFRNEGMIDGLPRFTDVSAAAGILTEGWGLGIVVNDINVDGYPDIYVANDFLSNDHMYINNGDGTFTNNIAAAMKHQEYNGMGTDIGDINNDGLQDILVVDMMPEDNLRQKTMFAATGYDKFQKNVQMHYQPQYVRNVLQLNNGNGTYSDIGYMAGVYATDWSWSALFGDMDNDGLQDIIITNGYRKDVTDLDFVAYSRESSLFGTDEIRAKKARKAIEEIDGVKKPDLIFKNGGALRFENVSKQWGIEQEAYGNGAAYVDLDNDGDLDLVVNNINDEAFIYRNRLREEGNEDSNFLRVKLQGSSGNINGIGTRIEIYHDSARQIREYETQRGYESTVEPFLHFGLGSRTSIDSMIVTWPNGSYQHFENVRLNQVITIEQRDARQQSNHSASIPSVIFDRVRGHQALPLKHHDDDYIDFKRTPTLPRKYSQDGPALAAGDINGDGLDDVIVCGSANQPASIFLQQADGSFKRDSLSNKAQEDAGILLFDADGDADLDLYCVSGSTEFGSQEGMYQDRFYRNDRGSLRLDTTALPVENVSGSVVTAADYDKDGDLDLFVGGRIVPGRYPESPESFILQNNGKGAFRNVTAAVAPALVRAGMITGALWTDFDNDGWIDMAVVGEWMPVTFLHNDHGTKFKKIFEGAPGWWNSITGADFDQDGDIDYVCGNLGWNSVFKASEDQPVSIYAKDFDNSGSFDPLISRYINGKEYFTHPRETLTDQIVGFKRRLLRYSFYGNSTRNDLLPEAELKDAIIYHATTFASSYIENLGQGKFQIRSLPVEAQITSMNGLQVADVNLDGNLDIVAVGNSYSMDPLAGYMDAGIGIVLLGNGAGSFKSLNVTHSGFFVNTDAKAMMELKGADNSALWMIASNRDSLVTFRQKVTPGVWVETEAEDVRYEFEWDSGKKSIGELYYGSGYLSQSTRKVYVPAGVRAVYLRNVRGERRRVIGHRE